jgi:hypothetical protein
MLRTTLRRHGERLYLGHSGFQQVPQHEFSFAPEANVRNPPILWKKTCSQSQKDAR